MIRHCDQNVAKNLNRRLCCVHPDNPLPGEEAEQGGRLPLIDLHALLQHLFIGVIEPLLNQGAFFQTSDKDFKISCLQHNEPLHIDIFGEKLRLKSGPGNPVENKELLLWMEAMRRNQPQHKVIPNFNRRLIGNQMTFFRVA